MEYTIFISLTAFYWAIGITTIIAAVYYWRNPEFRKQRAQVREYRNRIKNRPKAY